MTGSSSDRPRIQVRRDGTVATVVLNLPEKLNVLDGRGWADLRDAVTVLSDDDAVRCVLFQGAGGSAFSAGSDIRAFPTERGTPDGVRAYGERIHEALLAVQDCRHPTVAMISGVCVGGGLEIAACCDLRICGQSSRFGAPITRLGLTMAYEELAPIVRLLGPAVVLELLLTGALIDAPRAQQVGLVSRIVPDDQVAVAGRTLGQQIAEGAPLVNRWHKRFIRRLTAPPQLAEAERTEPYEAFDTSDYQEGIRAFLEKRPPRFEGK